MITDGNSAPVVTLVDPGGVEVPDGSPTTLEIASIVDPDDDTTSIEWFVDHELQPGQTGMSFTLATPAYGVTSVEVLVTDSQGAITRDGWLVAFLPAVDADRDGFWAVPGPDCDDEVAAVNPNEIGRASGRESGCQDVENPVVAGP